MGDPPDSVFFTSTPPKISVLFVCLGNICRSPMAEAVLRSLTHNLPPSSSPATTTTTTTPHPQIATIDSAGTGAYHTLEPPDPRTSATLAAHGIHGYEHGARKITLQDFEDFDYILAMDRSNLRDLEVMRSRASRKGRVKAQVRLFGEFGGAVGGSRKGGGEEVVDPYYGVDDGFEVVFEQAERFGRAFLEEVVEGRKGEWRGEGEGGDGV